MHKISNLNKIQANRELPIKHTPAFSPNSTNIPIVLLLNSRNRMYLNPQINLNKLNHSANFDD